MSTSLAVQGMRRNFSNSAAAVSNTLSRAGSKIHCAEKAGSSSSKIMNNLNQNLSLSMSTSGLNSGSRTIPGSNTSILDSTRAFSSSSNNIRQLQQQRPSYLDNQATTPVDPRVLDEMLPYMTGRFGNPHSRSHAYGWDSEKACEHARDQIAKAIGANRSKEIIFTSGATESNNLAIKGAAGYMAQKGKRHMITTETEHKCVLASMQKLQTDSKEPWDITYMPVDKDGLIDLAELKKAIRPDTALLSIMFVNNEIGTMQNMKEIGKLCKEHDVLFHTDAAQAVGKVPIDVNDLNIHMLSISGHKVYGPKGIGALYVRKKDPRVRLRPQMDGGGQEFGLRSGTLAPYQCVGLGKAVELCCEEMGRDHKHIEYLSKYMEKRIRDKLDAIELNGHPSSRWIGNLNLSFACVEGESLLMALSKVMSVSSGSACTSASLEPSYVLRALGVSEELAHTSLRFGIGRFTTKEEVDNSVDALVEAVTKLRDMSPLWEMYEESGGEAKKSGVKWG